MTEPHLPATVADWVGTHGIHAQLAPNAYTVRTWVKHCAPPGATGAQLALAHMDLAISFFFLDDYAGDDYPQLFEAFDANLAGRTPRDQRPAVRAHADLLQRVGALGRPMAFFLRSRRDLIEEYRHRNAVMGGRAQTSFERYLSARLVTIDVVQWFELWLVLCGVELTPAERSEPALMECVRLTCLTYVLANELHSVERDIRRGEPNLVCLLRDESDLDLDGACHRVQSQRVEAEQGCVRAAGQLCQAGGGLRWAGAFLRHLIDQATPARQANPDRYMR